MKDNNLVSVDSKSNDDSVNSEKVVVNDFSVKNICILLLIFVSLCSALVYGLVLEVSGKSDIDEVRSSDHALDIEGDTYEEQEEIDEEEEKESEKYDDKAENSGVNDIDSSNQAEKEEMINNDSYNDRNRERRNDIVGRFTKSLSIQLKRGEKYTVGDYEIMLENVYGSEKYMIKVEKCEEVCTTSRMYISKERGIDAIGSDIAIEYSTYYYPEDQLFVNVYYN